MKSSAASLGPSSRKIVARIQKVRRAAEKAAKRKHRFADYRYLRAVLRAYSHFDDEDLLPHLVEIAPSVLMTPVRANQHPLRVILDATCNQPDLRMRSRWTRALEYAVREEIDPNDLARFFRAHNGIAGCADMESKIGRKRGGMRRKKAPASKLFRQAMSNGRYAAIGNRTAGCSLICDRHRQETSSNAKDGSHSADIVSRILAARQTLAF